MAHSVLRVRIECVPKTGVGSWFMRFVANPVRHRPLRRHGPAVTFVLSHIEFGGTHKKIQEIETGQFFPSIRVIRKSTLSERSTISDAE